MIAASSISTAYIAPSSILQNPRPYRIASEAFWPLTATKGIN
jgi:hypothetical protein